MHNEINEDSKMKFYDKGHEDRYFSIMSRMRNNNERHASFAYLVSFVKVPVNDCFDFEKDEIKEDMLECEWIGSGSERVLKLAKNLWDFKFHADVSDVFSYVGDEYVEFMFYAIQIRYGYVPYLYCAGKDA